MTFTEFVNLVVVIVLIRMLLQKIQCFGVGIS